MGLSANEVQRQIHQMMAFIEQEANEKVAEIEHKAQEEFELEKGRLVQEQRVKIMEFYDKKEKQVELQRKIQNSHMQNAARLKILKAREEHIKNVLEESKHRLVEVTKDPKMYGKVLQKLMSQGFFQLLEENVVVRHRQQDKALVEDFLEAAKLEYEESTGKKVNVELDSEKFLPNDSCGGVVIWSRGGKIKCLNTLESRLDLISQQLLPVIRVALFGDNPNRKFSD